MSEVSISFGSLHSHCLLSAASKVQVVGILSRYRVCRQSEALMAPVLSHANPTAVGINMGITRQPEILVTPALPPPITDRFLYLSNLDDPAILRLHVPLIHFYRYNPSMKNQDPVKTIREALSKTLVHYFPFAGRLRDADNSKLQLECTGEGVLFVEADAPHLSLKDFGDVICPPFPSLDELLYQPSGSETITNSPLLIVQVTRLKCGGFIFALRFNHCMTDAIGILQFLKALAEMARGASQPSILPVWNREILQPRTNTVDLTDDEQYADHHALNLSADDEYAPQQHVEEEMQTVSVLFGPEEIADLKSQVGGKCSTFEVLSAWLWRSRSKVLNIPADQESSLVFPIDIRSRLQPPLPSGYYGNGLSVSFAVARAGDLIEKPLSFAVKLISDAKRIVDDEYVRAQIDMLEVVGHTAPTLVGSFMTNDHSKVDFAGVDFGWGKAEYGGVAVAADPNESMYVRVRSTSSGIEKIVVPICLPTTAIQTLQQDLRYATC